MGIYGANSGVTRFHSSPIAQAVKTPAGKKKKGLIG